MTVTNCLEYAAGERPEAIEYTFLDADGAAMNLSGFTASVGHRKPDGSYTTYTSQVAITDAAAGEVTFQWPANALDLVGKHRIVIWVSTASNTFASPPIEVVTSDYGAGPT